MVAPIGRGTRDIVPDVFLVFEDRPSESPFVERVWRCHSERAGTFTSMASSHLEMVVTSHHGRTFLTLRGPETRATEADCPVDGEWLAIRFRLGTFMPQHPASRLRDRRDEQLPAASARTFVLDGWRWEYPDFENADTFVARLARRGVIARDTAVEAALHGERTALSRRSTQRHFLQAMGMTHGTHRQIERARHAVTLLTQGASILDTVHEAGYFDQAHLTRSFARLIGQTPARVARRDQQLSFLPETSTAY
jgi:AraC-like DNA-binding protein